MQEITVTFPSGCKGINPKDCGYVVDDSTFKLMRNMFEQEKLEAEGLEIFWKPIQEMIPDRIENNILESKEFFEWFRTLDFRSIEKDVWLYRDLYTRLPYPLSNMLEKSIN